MAKNKWDYVFIFSSPPTPRMLDKVRLAVELGFCVACCYLKRPNQRLRVETIDGCDIVEKPVNFNGVSIRRLLSVPYLVAWLRFSLFNNTAESGRIHTDSLDLLILCQIAAFGRNFIFHHQVRDLHKLQLKSGICGHLVRAIDRLAMSRVSMLVLTCEGYFENYYKTIYSGEYVVVENWPDYAVWKNFEKKPNSIFTIGFVGVIRYLKCFETLIQAIDLLRKDGVDIRLKIAGGGELKSFSELIEKREWIEQTGAFDYGLEITSIYADVDLIWSVYDTSLQNVRIAMPNKFYEAILSRIPIVVAENTHLANRVYLAGIGTCVPCDNKETIAKILAIACKKEGWYTAAMNALADLNPSVYFEQEHPLRLKRAVTGNTSQPKPFQTKQNQTAA